MNKRSQNYIFKTSDTFQKYSQNYIFKTPNTFQKYSQHYILSINKINYNLNLTNQGLVGLCVGLLNIFGQNSDNVKLFDRTDDLLDYTQLSNNDVSIMFIGKNLPWKEIQAFAIYPYLAKILKPDLFIIQYKEKEFIQSIYFLYNLLGLSDKNIRLYKK